ncbi:hypothetical protein DFQ28_004839 [Apophysomyces sp. BC1034]|nr:hypothetical protein DFQ28_004839 [Apophysomyces sp. BC1034]
MSTQSLEQANNELGLDYIRIDSDFMAVAGVFQDEQFIDYLGKQPYIDYVEPNQIYTATVVLPHKGALKTAVSPNWGMARIQQRAKESYNYYSFNDTAGAGVDVYVLDTGVYVGHNDFEGRAEIIANFVRYEDNEDHAGHGTHVAGKIAGKTYGIAKGANIKAIKILDVDGSGDTINLLKGIGLVNNVARRGKSIVNLSLAGPRSAMVDEALSMMVNRLGIPTFVASGNAGSDACLFSPGGNPDVFAVGATDKYDSVPLYSDTGRCVQMYAPGSGIESTWVGSPDAVKIKDGTSMANPHVTGIAATLMSKDNYWSAKQVYNALITSATVDVLSFSFFASEPNVNLLVYNGN